jgi:ABC-type multidrug transport system fused ATPase/permease subunit
MEKIDKKRIKPDINPDNYVIKQELEQKKTNTNLAFLEKYTRKYYYYIILIVVSILSFLVSGAPAVVITAVIVVPFFWINLITEYQINNPENNFTYDPNNRIFWWSPFVYSTLIFVLTLVPGINWISGAILTIIFGIMTYNSRESA